jgi:Fe-S-cluster-containing hydrogenase component 2
MDSRKAYAELRRHLDTLPVGFPRSRAGGRILRRLFTPAEARAALGLSWKFRGPAEVEGSLEARGIDPLELVREAGLDPEPAGSSSGSALSALLRAMSSKGSILRKATDDTYALLPFVVGMYEMQIARISRELVRDTTEFLYQGFGLELLTTGEPQTRVIPIGAAIRPEHRIAEYDECRSLIRNAGGRIAVLDCICRRAADLAGKPCKSTDRRELCMVFRDFADTVIREGWGRAVGETEALNLADLNQREGLVMRPSNEREPQFLCACCGDCCGLLSVVKAMRRPADFVATNHRAAAVPDNCTSCGACARICPMEAIVLDGPAAKPGGRRTARVLESRCIGCGVCTVACKFEALRLDSLTPARVPPKDTEELLDRLAAARPGPLRKLGLGIAGILGLRAHPHGRRRRS